MASTIDDPRREPNGGLFYLDMAQSRVDCPWPEYDGFLRTRVLTAVVCEEGRGSDGREGELGDGGEREVEVGGEVTT